MTLLEKIASLSENSPQLIKENFTFDEIKFEILEKMESEPDLSSISNLFIEVDETMSDQAFYNIFAERVALKTLYLHHAYSLNLDILNILVQVDTLVVLDKKLEEILKNDEYYLYIKEAFKEHKINNGMSLNTIMKYLSTIDIAPLVKELEGQVGDLKKISKQS